MVLAHGLKLRLFLRHNSLLLLQFTLRQLDFNLRRLVLVLHLGERGLRRLLHRVQLPLRIPQLGRQLCILHLRITCFMQSFFELGSK